MFRHLTLMRFHAGRAAEIAAAIEAGRRLADEIPTIRSMSCGPARASDMHDFDLAFELAFDDRTGYEAFAAHEAHERYVERHVHDNLDHITSVDYDDGAIVATEGGDQ
jgi:hypothetical protein